MKCYRQEMLHPSHTSFCVAGLFLLAALPICGCEGDPATHSQGTAGAAGADGKNGSDARPAEKAAAAKKTEFGKNVWLETQGKNRRVIVGATVVLREGSYGLECLLCRKF
ncbi:MAG TPA: hypothetical protein VG099_24310, partial [Gemmataceae bacterium]|nr:hypothetical protein [Gemmataceae bacterium]